jgi:hypothetical protein
MARFSIRTSLAVAIFVAAIPAAAQADVCHHYIQESSNAGNCDSCTVDLDQDGRGYIVKSNNGWAARATWKNGDPEEAEGAGVWDDNLGNRYAGQPFDFYMMASGGDLDVTMTMQNTRRFPGEIDVRYHCGD